MPAKSMIRLRLSQHHAHYGGDLVSGAQIMEFFGDVATELLIATDGDEGLFRAYENVEFLAPAYAGDYLEIEGEITQSGNTSRGMRFEARKVIEATRKDGRATSAAEVLNKPVVIARAEGTCVVPKELQRKSGKKGASKGKKS